eukprot:10379750-Alexandrium_andersonii.AAC.1
MRSSSVDGQIQVAIRNVLVALLPDLAREMVHGLRGARRDQYPPLRSGAVGASVSDSGDVQRMPSWS